jgi:alpha-L-fucosidase 2
MSYQRVSATVALVILFALESCAAARGSDAALTLRYDTPARSWNRALPVGNGRLGAMVFGGTAEERLQVNEDTVWAGEPHDYAHKAAVKYLPEIRRLLFEGNQRAAEALAEQQFMSVPLFQLPYQPFIDLKLHFDGHDRVEDYERTLDLDQATASVRYKVDGVNFRRDVFCSFPIKCS